MRLKAGKLYWPSTYRPGLGEKLPKGDIRCDVLVVGAGVSGAMAAERLAASGARVVVVDRRPPVSGSTPASTALVLYEIDRPLAELCERLGPRRGCAAYRASYDAVDEVSQLVSGLDDRCELRQRPSLYLATVKGDIDPLRKEARARRRLGIDARFLDAKELEARFGFQRPGAIVSERALEVNPVRLTDALLRSAAGQGALVYANVQVEAWNLSDAGRQGVATADGCTITADWVVIATGYEAPEQFATVARLTRLKSTYAIGTSPLEGDPWPERAMLWERAEPYLYGRATADGRVLFGGLDIATSDPVQRDRLIVDKGHQLARALRRLAPKLRFRVDYRWAGTFGETADGLPYIGSHPRWKRVLFSLGYGGNGLTWSVIGARLIADAVLGRNNRLARLYSFSRAE